MSWHFNKLHVAFRNYQTFRNKTCFTDDKNGLNITGQKTTFLMGVRMRESLWKSQSKVLITETRTRAEDCVTTSRLLFFSKMITWLATELRGWIATISGPQLRATTTSLCTRSKWWPVCEAPINYEESRKYYQLRFYLQNSKSGATLEKHQDPREKQQHLAAYGPAYTCHFCWHILSSCCSKVG